MIPIYENCTGAPKPGGSGRRSRVCGGGQKYKFKYKYEYEYIYRILFMEYVEVGKHRYSQVTRPTMQVGRGAYWVTLLITTNQQMTKCYEHFNHLDHRSGLHPRLSGNSHTFSTDYHHSLNLIVKPGVDLATAGDVDGQANPTLCARCRGSGELLLNITIMMIILITMASQSVMIITIWRKSW